MAKNPAHMDNFRVHDRNRVAICDVTRDAVRGTHWYEIVSGKDEADARMRFYRYYMLRAGDRFMVDEAQRNNRLYIVQMDGPCMTLLERNAMLIALPEKQAIAA